MFTRFLRKILITGKIFGFGHCESNIGGRGHCEPSNPREGYGHCY